MHLLDGTGKDQGINREYREREREKETDKIYG